MELLVLATVFFGVLLTVLAVYVVANRRQLQAAERARAAGWWLRRGGRDQHPA
jgi:hypothetical protein